MWFAQWSGCLCHWRLWKCSPSGRHIFEQFLGSCEGRQASKGRLRHLQRTHRQQGHVDNAYYMRSLEATAQGVDIWGLWKWIEFSRIMDLTGETLVVNFLQFIEVSSSMFVHHLSHSSCTMADEIMQKQTNKTKQHKTKKLKDGSWEEPSALEFTTIICPHHFLWCRSTLLPCCKHGKDQDGKDLAEKVHFL